MNAGRMVGLSWLVAVAACGGGESNGGGEDRNDAIAVVDAGPAANRPPGGTDAADAGAGRPASSPLEASADTQGSGQDATVPAADAGVEPVDVGELRIVLTWGRRPNDLDAHLTGPDPDGPAYFHVFSGDRRAGGARLVEDATTGTGPETIEVDRRDAGVHRYSVFNFSSDADRPLERSGARVEVFSDTAYLAGFTVPSGPGNLWTVFDLDGGEIVAVNAITRLRNVLDHFPPQGREPAFGAAIVHDVNPYR